VLGITPAPAGARFHGSLPKLGAPAHTADYADGFKICAYIEPADPTIGQPAGRRYLPWQWGPDKQAWAQRALPDQPRPIYRPENLENHPDWPVYIFEREDMADAFNALSGDDEVLGTTIPGGAGAFTLGDWGPLYGRPVTLWPTNRPECVQAMHELARKLEKAGCKVSVISIPQDKPPAWSFLDVVEAKWTWEQAQAFMRSNTRQVDAQVVPIGPARARMNSAPAIAEPAKRTRQQPAGQALIARDVWSMIPGLDMATNGTPYSNLANIVTAMQHFQGKYADVWYDEFHCKVMTDSQHPREWTDSDSIDLCMVIQKELKLAAVRTPIVVEAVDYLAKKTRRHEVKDWLNTLKWDGDLRLPLMLYCGWGAEPNPYISAVGRCFLMGAVARILNPGCQVDNVPVFEGSGGIGKTSSLRVLFGLRWFDNPTAMFGEKDFLQNMNGKWCLELGELANVKGRALEVVKSTITRVEDTYRASYGRAAGSYKRQCVFAGTIDHGRWNADRAGGRRWWPVKCGKINLEWIAENRDQLFAEAVHRVNDGQSWHDVPAIQAAEEQGARAMYDLWYPLVAPYAEAREKVTLHDILRYALELDVREWDARAHDRITGILIQIKWREQRDGSWAKP
jgi:hypothetical protein